MPNSPEITAATKVLNRDHEAEYQAVLADYIEKWHPPLLFSPPAPPTSRDIAKMVLEAAEVAREKSAKFAAVGQISLPDGSLNHLVVAPFSTELQARKAGEGLQHDYKTGTGSGRFMVVPVFNSHKDAWEYVRPPEEDPHEWIKKSIENQRAGQPDQPNTDSIYGASYWQRSNW